MTTILGLHAPNAALSADDLRVVRLMGSPSVKLLAIDGCRHTPTDLLTLRAAGVRDFTVRLPDTRDHDTGVYPSAEGYVEAVLPTIRAFYALGVRRFQLDNEPNVEGMWDHRGYGPDNYQYFIRHVLRLLRPRIPADVILVSPPLSYSPAYWRHDPPGTPWEERVNKTDFILDQWIAAYHYTDGGNLPNLWRIFDEVGANVYWQSERQMRDTSYGLAYEQLSARAGGMPVCVLEFANSSEGAGRGEARRVQYPEWLSEARESGMVRRAYAFISPGATVDWASFRLTDDVAAAMSEADLRGQSRAVGGGRGLV